MHKRPKLLAVSLVAVFLTHMAVAGQANTTSFNPGALPAPLHSHDLSGKLLSLAQYRGKVILLHFWTTRCPMCRVELPNVLAVYRKWHSHGLEVIGLPLDNTLTLAQMRRYVNENHFPWRVSFDGKGWDSPAIQPYHVDTMPFSLLIGRDGRIAVVDPRGPALDATVQRACSTSTRTLPLLRRTTIERNPSPLPLTPQP